MKTSLLVHAKTGFLGLYKKAWLYLSTGACIGESSELAWADSAWGPD